LNDKEETNSELFPDNVLIISTITETDRIYIVSDSSQNLISQSPLSLINKKFGDVFHQVSNENPMFLTYQLPDKKTIKTFYAEKDIKGKFTHYILIDEKSKVLSYKDNIEIKAHLARIIPSFFATKFHENEVNSIVLKESYYIFLRIRNDIQDPGKFYSSLNFYLAKFQNVQVIHATGSIIELIICNGYSIGVLFFIRDMINCSSFSKLIPLPILILFKFTLSLFGFSLLGLLLELFSF